MVLAVGAAEYSRVKGNRAASTLVVKGMGGGVDKTLLIWHDICDASTRSRSKPMLMSALTRDERGRFC